MNEDLIFGQLKNGAWLATYQTDDKGKNLLTKKFNEPIIHKIMERLVKPGDTVIELGANYGMIAITLSQLVGNTGRVHAIEASPPIAAACRLNLQVNNYTQALFHHVAILDRRT